MKSRPYLTVAVLLAVAFLTSGCEMFDTVSHWFDAGPKKSKLKGERISVMTLDETLKPDPTLKDIGVVLPAPYKNDNWPEPGGYADNAMYHLEANGPLEKLWQIDAGAGSNDKAKLTAPPVVAEGRVYTLDARERVFAFNAETGEEVWHVGVQPKGRQSLAHALSFGLFGSDTRVDATKGFGGGLAYDGGRLFATTGYGDIVALDAATGKELWRDHVGVPIFNAPVANGGRVFVSSQDNHFHAFAQTNGRELWDHQGITESAGIMAATSAAVRGNFVLVPYTSGELFALNVQNGRPAWSDLLTRSGNLTALSEIDDIAGRPVVDRDLVFAISHSGVMVAINLDTGDRVWSRDIGGLETPWVAGDYVYVLASPDLLMCLTRKEGRVKWAHQLPRSSDPDDSSSAPVVWAGPVLVSNRLVMVSSNGFGEAISPYTGELLGRVKIPHGATIAPVVANGTLYVYTRDATLVALR
jgi:outer membrane protein assembly factor BamB